jgi:hypothetical protein
MLYGECRMLFRIETDAAVMYLDAPAEMIVTAATQYVTWRREDDTSSAWITFVAYPVETAGSDGIIIQHIGEIE